MVGFGGGWWWLWFVVFKGTLVYRFGPRLVLKTEAEQLQCFSCDKHILSYSESKRVTDTHTKSSLKRGNFLWDTEYIEAKLSARPGLNKYYARATVRNQGQIRKKKQRKKTRLSCFGVRAHCVVFVAIS